MTKQTRRRFSPEYKEQVVARLLKLGLRIPEWQPSWRSYAVTTSG